MARVTAPAKSPPSTPQSEFGDKVRAHQRYYSNGRQVPGVTTVLGILNKPQLVAWANRMGLEGIDTKKYTSEAAAIGSLAHALSAEELGGSAVNHDDYTAAQLQRAQHGVQAFHAWRRGHQLKPQLVETPLVSDEHGYGGTIDCLAYLDGDPVLLDLKSGSGIYDEYVYQCGGYWKLLEENGYPIRGARILRIGRTEGEGTEERVLSGKEILNGWLIFKACLEIYKLKKK